MLRCPATWSVARALNGLILILACLLPGGCGVGKPTGQLTGQVVYQGRPITVGEVNLYARSRGIGARATLDSHGRFSVAEPLETGTYQVFVTPPAPADPGRSSAPARTTTLAIPRRFQELSTSTLTVQIQEGTNEVTITVTD